MPRAAVDSSLSPSAAAADAGTPAAGEPSKLPIRRVGVDPCGTFATRGAIGVASGLRTRCSSDEPAPVEWQPTSELRQAWLVRPAGDALVSSFSYVGWRCSAAGSMGEGSGSAGEGATGEGSAGGGSAGERCVGEGSAGGGIDGSGIDGDAIEDGGAVVDCGGGGGSEGGGGGSEGGGGGSEGGGGGGGSEGGGGNSADVVGAVGSFGDVRLIS